MNLWLFLVLLFILLNQNVITGCSYFLIFKYVTHVRIHKMNRDLLHIKKILLLAGLKNVDHERNITFTNFLGNKTIYIS